MFTEEEVSIFLEELEEKIQAISDNLLLLEQGSNNPEVLQEIFRAAHTIKGSSAVMGYEKMSTLTHEIENIFEQLRQGTLEVNESLIDILFEALDTLKELKDEVTSGQSIVQDIQPVITRLRGGGKAFLSGQLTMVAGTAGEVKGESLSSVLPDFDLDDVEESLIREAEVRGYQAYWIDIVIDSGCQMKAARAFLIFETLQRTGEIIKSIPPAEELQEGRYGSGFTVVVVTREDAGQLKNLVLTIAEVSSVQVRPVQIQNVVTAVDESESVQRNNLRDGYQQVSRENIKTVRVDVQKLDTLMNLVGELVIDRTRLDRFVSIFKNRYGSDDLAENVVEISNHLGQVTGDLQEEIMKARMLPIAHVFNRLPRMVRDLAHKMGKEVEFVIEGRETELDRNVIEVIGDPLIHLLRNAVDHGIEPPEERLRLGKPRKGKILLKAAYVESHIVITLFDDGRGMDVRWIRQKAIEGGLLSEDAAARASDREVLDLIFVPGFSTSIDVNHVSGRGVGMDIVRNQIEQINGSVEFITVPGKGTTFTIKLPLTLAIIRALMVGLGEQVYAFPLTNVVETIALKPDEVKRVGHSEVIVVRGHVLPLVRLSHLFQQEDREGDRLSVVILGSGEKKVGVVVERLIGEQEIVIKSLGGYLGQPAGLSGATILGDGRVALIVDARGIIREAGVEEVATAS